MRILKDVSRILPKILFSIEVLNDIQIEYVIKYYRLLEKI